MALWRFALILKLVCATQQTRFSRPGERCLAGDDEAGVSLLQRQVATRSRNHSREPRRTVTPLLQEDAVQMTGALEQQGLVLQHGSASTSQVAIRGPMLLLISGGVATALLLGGGIFLRTQGSEVLDREKIEGASMWSRWAYFVTASIYSVCTSIMVIKFPYHLMDLGLNGLQLSTVQSSALLGGAAGALFLGWLSDAVGSRKWVLVFCSIMCSITYLLLPLFRVLPILMAIQFCSGFFGGTLPVEIVFIIDGVPAAQRPSVLAMQQFFITIGTVAGSFMNTTGFASMDFDSVCYLMSGLGLIRTALSYRFFVDGPQSVVRHIASESAKPELETDRPFQSLVSDLAHPVIISLIMLAGIKEMGWGMTVGTEAMFFKNVVGMDARSYSMNTLIGEVFSLVTCALAPRVIDSIGSLQACTYFGLISSLSLMPIIADPSEATGYIKNIAAYGVSKFIVIIASLDIVSENSPTDRRATVFALCKAGERLATICAEPVGGALYDNFSPCIGYVICSAGMAISSAGYAFLPPSSVNTGAQGEATLNNHIVHSSSNMADESRRHLFWYRLFSAMGTMVCLCLLSIAFYLSFKVQSADKSASLR